MRLIETYLVILPPTALPPHLPPSHMGELFSSGFLIKRKYLEIFDLKIFLKNVIENFVQTLFSKFLFLKKLFSKKIKEEEKQVKIEKR